MDDLEKTIEYFKQETEAAYISARTLQKLNHTDEENEFIKTAKWNAQIADWLTELSNWRYLYRRR